MRFRFHRTLCIKVLLTVLGAAIVSFGIYNIHRQTNITEGGVLGMVLLVNRWLGISPALATPILDITCYLLALRVLGFGFLKWSAVATLCVSCFFRLWESFPPLLPDLSPYPLAAALLGGLFVGVGVGLIIRQGGSSGGDDALALTISYVTHWRLSFSYLFTDLTVLLLSLTYIPLGRIVFSLITVTVSSLVVDWIQHPHRPRLRLRKKAGME